MSPALSHPGHAWVPAPSAYDLRGLQTQARFDSLSGEGVTNAYDGFGRLVSSGTSMGGTTRTLTYQYDADGNRTQIAHPDGTAFWTAYDGLDRPFYLAFGATGIAGATYNPDGTLSVLGRLSGFTSFHYDGLQRPTLMFRAFGQGVQVSYGYSRNAAGQLTEVSRDNDAFAFTGHANANVASNVNGLNQYATAGGATLAYDANGNLTSDGTSTFVYDVENRLVGRSGGVTLAYDPLGRLYRVASSTTDTRFLYDGDALVAEYDAAGAMLRRHVHWPGADAPVATYEGSGLTTMRQLFADHQGSIVALTDGPTGAMVGIDSYDEYGVPGATNAGRFQYTGQIWLPEIGLYHYKARIYSPTLGRFLQTDPIGYDDQINLYTYVGNDPVNQSDPTGNQVVIAPSRVPIILPPIFNPPRAPDEGTLGPQWSPGEIRAEAQSTGARAGGNLGGIAHIAENGASGNDEERRGHQVGGTYGGRRFGEPAPIYAPIPAPIPGAGPPAPLPTQPIINYPTPPEITGARTEQPDRVPAEHLAAEAGRAATDRARNTGRLLDKVIDILYSIAGGQRPPR